MFRSRCARLLFTSYSSISSRNTRSLASQSNSALDQAQLRPSNEYIDKCVKALTDTVNEFKAKKQQWLSATTNTLQLVGSLLYPLRQSLLVDKLEKAGIQPYWDAEQHLVDTLMDPRSVRSVQSAFDESQGPLQLHVHLNFEPCDYCSWRLLNLLPKLQDMFGSSRLLFMIVSASSPYRQQGSKGMQSMLDAAPENVKQHVRFIPLWRRQQPESHDILDASQRELPQV